MVNFMIFPSKWDIGKVAEYLLKNKPVLTLIIFVMHIENSDLIE